MSLALVINQIASITNGIWERCIEIVYAPTIYKEMIWIVSPLLLTMVLMEFYFGRYTDEELGWNTAFGNSLVLIFVSIDLIRYLYNSNNLLFFFNVVDMSIFSKNVVVFVVIIIGFLLVLLDFYHALPKKFAYGISSKSPINFLALIAIILVYSNISLDWITGVAILFLAIIVYILVAIIYFLAPKERKLREVHI